jgi:cephalosporin hydroxylase
MRITIDTDLGFVELDAGGERRRIPLESAEAFAIVSEAWLRAGWDVKYIYSFTWLGRPIIQLPEDMFRLQETIYSLKPDIIIECGVAHGGSLVFYAGLCKLIGHGRVIGVDVEIRKHNRSAIEAHPLSHLITLIEHDSISDDALRETRKQIPPNAKVMVCLDSNHSYNHVSEELERYGPLVSRGSYIVVMDGIMGKLVSAPRSKPDWGSNNPLEAARAWIARHPEFVVEEPPFQFNEGLVKQRVTYWPGAYLKRIS